MAIRARIGPRLTMVAKPKKALIQARWKGAPRLKQPKHVTYFAGMATPRK